MKYCDLLNINITGPFDDRGKRARSLPPVPLTDEILEDVDLPDGVTLWVSKTRPKSVTTSRGRHEGDVIDFFVETENCYARYTYSGKWYRYKQIRKDGEYVETFEEFIEDDYRPLSGESE